MISIAGFHNKSRGRLHRSYLSGDKNNCCMALLTNDNREKLASSEPTRMRGVALIFPPDFPDHFYTSGELA